MKRKTKASGNFISCKSSQRKPAKPIVITDSESQSGGTQGTSISFWLSPNLTTSTWKMSISSSSSLCKWSKSIFSVRPIKLRLVWKLGLSIDTAAKTCFETCKLWQENLELAATEASSNESGCFRKTSSTHQSCRTCTKAWVIDRKKNWPFPFRSIRHDEWQADWHGTNWLGTGSALSFFSTLEAVYVCVPALLRLNESRSIKNRECAADKQFTVTPDLKVLSLVCEQFWTVGPEWSRRQCHCERWTPASRTSSSIWKSSKMSCADARKNARGSGGPIFAISASSSAAWSQPLSCCSSFSFAMSKSSLFAVFLAHWVAVLRQNCTCVRDSRRKHWVLHLINFSSPIHHFWFCFLWLIYTKPTLGSEEGGEGANFTQHLSLSKSFSSSCFCFFFCSFELFWMLDALCAHFGDKCESTVL